MRIAIIGAGISGLVTAYLLSDSHDIVVYETNDYIGGHTHTIDVPVNGHTYAVDTGFIVFNEKKYSHRRPFWQARWPRRLLRQVPRVRLGRKNPGDALKTARRSRG